MAGAGTKVLKKRLSVDMVRTWQTEERKQSNYIGVWLGQQRKSCCTPTETEQAPTKRKKGPDRPNRVGLEGTSLLALA